MSQSSTITTLLDDQINETTSGIVINFERAVRPFMERSTEEPSTVLDRHGGTPDTSISLYLMPNLVQLDKAVAAEMTLPKHLEKMLPDVIAGEPTALMLFLAEGLNAEETGKKYPQEKCLPQAFGVPVTRKLGLP